MEEIVQEVLARVMAARNEGGADNYRCGVSVGVSNRHIHLNKADLSRLFGSSFKLEAAKELSQPGEFASTSFVDIEANGRLLKQLRVLGPLRPRTQIEISATDARALKINPPVRNSGDLDGSEALTLTGPAGKLELSEGCIIASRHLHLTEEDAQRVGVRAGQQVSIRVFGDKSGVLNNVFCRISDDYSFELHIDADDANAFQIKNGDIAEIIV